MKRAVQLAARLAQAELCTVLPSASTPTATAAFRSTLAQRWQSAYRGYHCTSSSRDALREGVKKGDMLSSEGERLFTKVLGGKHVPPVDPNIAAQASASTTSGRVLDTMSNVLFYGLLSATAIFAGSYYAYSDAELVTEVKRLQSAAAHADAPLGLVAQPSGSGAVGRHAGEPGGGSGIALSGPADSDGHHAKTEEANQLIDAALRVGLQQLHSVRSWVAEKRVEYEDPPSDSLLPDLDPREVQIGLRTLVLDLDGVLVHSEWSRAVGWKTFKRPGATDVLGILSQHYELVVFTNQSHTYADPILNRIDPGCMSHEVPAVRWRLYKNSTQYVDGEYSRDLSKLNRDMSKVLFLTSKKRAGTTLQPENTIVVEDWDNMDPTDTTLLDLVPMLQMLVTKNVPDTRTVCKSYWGKDVVSTFRERMASTQGGGGGGAQEAPMRRKFFAVPSRS